VKIDRADRDLDDFLCAIGGAAVARRRRDPLAFAMMSVRRRGNRPDSRLTRCRA
jgi:hypothetical protein